MARKQIDRIVVALQAENEELERKLREAQSSLKKFADTADTANKRAANSMGYSDVATRKVAKSMDNMTYRVTNASRQLQDVAVQAQAGTDAFTILAQQGSQLAEVFGRNGPLIGGVIAITAAVGGALWKAFDAAGAKADELREKLEGVYAGTLTARIAAAKDMVEGQKDAMKALRDEAEQLNKDIPRFEAVMTTKAFVPGAEGAQMAAQQKLVAIAERQVQINEELRKGEVTLAQLVKDRDELMGQGNAALNQRVEAIRQAGLTELQAERERHEQAIADLQSYGATTIDAAKKVGELRIAELLRHENAMQKIIADSEEKKAKVRDTSASDQLKADRALAAERRRLASEWQAEQQGNAMIDKMVDNTLKDVQRYWAEQRKIDTEANAFIEGLVQQSLEGRKAYMKELNDLLVEYDPIAREMAVHNARMTMLQDEHNMRLMGEIKANQAIESERLRHEKALSEAKIQSLQASGDHIAAVMEKYRYDATHSADYFSETMAGAVDGFVEGFSRSMARSILYAEDWRDALDNVAKMMAENILAAMIQMGTQILVLKAMGSAATAAATAEGTAAAGTLAVAYAPAAAGASLATAGANSAPAITGINITYALVGALAGAALVGMAHDGIAQVPKEGTWLLDKGERVFSADHNERLVRALEGGGTERVNVTNVFQISAGVEGTVQAEIMKTLPAIQRMSVASVEQALRSGGSLSRAAGVR